MATYVTVCTESIKLLVAIAQSEVKTGNGDHLKCTEILNYHVVYI